MQALGLTTKSFLDLKQSREHIDTLLLCLKAAATAISQNSDINWSFAKDYSLLR